MTNFRPSQTERVCRRQFYFDKKWQKFSKPKENTVGKGEISRYEQFSFSQCFHKTLLWTHKKPGSVFTNHSLEHSLSFSPRFANLNVKQLLIG